MAVTLAALGRIRAAHASALAFLPKRELATRVRFSPSSTERKKGHPLGSPFHIQWWRWRLPRRNSTLSHLVVNDC